MNDNTSQSSTEIIFRRLEEPVNLFGNTLPSWVWVAMLAGVLAIGLFYIIVMYLRDSRSIGPWAIFLGFLRTMVYALLALVFLMPAEQTWHETNRTSKVVLVMDVSKSLTETRDETPPESKTIKDMPTRQQKVLSWLMKDDIGFMDR